MMHTKVWKFLFHYLNYGILSGQISVGYTRYIGVTTSHLMTLELFTIALWRLDVRSLQA